jgi:hypothetical protein
MYLQPSVEEYDEVSLYMVSPVERIFRFRT